MVYSGSLSSQVESLAWKNKIKTNLHVFTLKDKFIHCYGSHEQLLNKHEISIPKILKNLIMNIFITGVSGFSEFLAEKLSYNFNVYGIYRNDNSTYLKNIKNKHLNLLSWI